MPWQQGDACRARVCRAGRMWGRALGLTFVLPLAYFLARGAVNGALGKRLGLLFFMGGTQGLVGWWMVRSGLEVRLPWGGGLLTHALWETCARDSCVAPCCEARGQSRERQWVWRNVRAVGLRPVAPCGRACDVLCSCARVCGAGAQARVAAGAREPVPPGGAPGQRLCHLCHAHLDGARPRVSGSGVCWGAEGGTAALRCSWARVRCRPL